MQVVAGAVEGLPADTGPTSVGPNGGGRYVPIGEQVGEEGAGDAQARGQMGGTGGMER